MKRHEEIQKGAYELFEKSGKVQDSTIPSQGKPPALHKG
jgi:hypothetical protein